MTDYRDPLGRALPFLVAGVLGCHSAQSAPASQRADGFAVAPAGKQSDGSRDSVAIFLGAADIAECDWDRDEATAALLDSLISEAGAPVTVYAAGDLAYERGDPNTARESSQ